MSCFSNIVTTVNEPKLKNNILSLKQMKDVGDSKHPLCVV